MKAAVAPGAIFGGYRIDSIAGRGGMGIVYRATDLSLERPVALKLIAPELAEDERFRARFLIEPRLAASLDHPSVVPIYEAGEREGRLYLAMRWVDGTDLRRRLEAEGRLAPEEALPILIQVAGALDATHRRGLVHRDVKPANILLDHEGHAYLTDFGITKPLEGAAVDGGQIAGTTDYLAPEQIRGEAVDARTDCYALACVVYECLTGAPPYRRSTEAETLWAHLREPPPPVRDYPALETVLRHGLAKERDERPATCAELMQAARIALGLSPTGERRVSRAVALLIAGSLLVAVAAVLAALTVGGGETERVGGPLLDVATNSVAAVDLDGGGVALAAPLPGRPTDVAGARGTVWVSSVDSTAVTGVNARGRAISRTVPLTGGADAVAVGAGSVWVADARRGVVSRIQTGYETVTERFRFRPSPDATSSAGRLQAPRASLAVAGGAVWLADHRRGLVRIDVESGDVRTVRSGGQLDAVAASGGKVWAIGSRSGTVVRFAADAERAADAVRLPRRDGSPFPIAIAATERAAWVLNGEAATVAQIDPRTLSVAATIPLAAERVPTDIAASGRTAWVTNGDGSLSRIDAGARSTHLIRVGESLERVATEGRRVWVTTTAFDQKLPGGVG